MDPYQPNSADISCTSYPPTTEGHAQDWGSVKMQKGLQRIVERFIVIKGFGWNQRSGDASAQ